MTTRPKSQQPGMRFTCDQPWEAMRPNGMDRYCERCAKSVIDFTEWSRADLKAWYAEHPESCGRFLLEQVDPGMVPLPGLPRGLLNGAMAILAALALHTAQAQVTVTRPTRIEQVPATSRTTEQRSVLSAEKCWMEKPECGTVAVRRDRPKYYVSMRFPFLHKRRVIRTIGCPSF